MQGAASVLHYLRLPKMALEAASVQTAYEAFRQTYQRVYYVYTQPAHILRRNSNNLAPIAAAAIQTMQKVDQTIKRRYTIYTKHCYSSFFGEFGVFSRTLDLEVVSSGL